ncbi:hypothetical protein FKP32DRAFT_1594450 [Trametes sanguinea]|nr:hypothetical protein FKP32DRAFT_1594450 [Trametes sanguinea]
MAWLSEEQLQEIEDLESRSAAQPANVREDDEGHRRRPQSVASTSAAATAPREEGRAERVRSGDSSSSAWMDQADRAMEVWAEVLRVAVDRASGVTREEQTRLADPYADWAEPAPPGFDYAIW